MNTPQAFEVILSSAASYERLTADIFVGGKFVATISQERGPRQFVVEFPGLGLDETQVVRSVDLDVLCEALAVAQRRLASE